MKSGRTLHEAGDAQPAAQAPSAHVGLDRVPTAAPTAALPPRAARDQDAASAVASGPGPAPVAPRERPDDRTWLIPPYDWCFRSGRVAASAGGVLAGVGWLGLVALRWWVWPGEHLYWTHELLLLAAFAYAGWLSVFLARRCHDLHSALRGRSEDLDALLLAQARRFHGWPWLVVMPPLLSLAGISTRFLFTDYLKPFFSFGFELCFLAWLWAGFGLILHATVLVGRYSEITRELGEAALQGKMSRQDLARVSQFYLVVGLCASIYFAFAAIVVFSMHLIYTYYGETWPGYVYIMQLPGRIWRREWAVLTANTDLMYEVIFILLLHLAASLASIAYMVLPQWSVHRLLVKRKRQVTDLVANALDDAENQMIANPNEMTIDRYSRLAEVLEQLEKLPEWPFSGRGVFGTLLLLGIPAVMIFLKEIVLEALIGLLTRMS